MFETSRRPHPLHTFRFWFVVVAAGAVTLAWKFDLLPFRVGPAATGKFAADAFTAIDSPTGEPADTGSEFAPLPFDEADDDLAVPTLTRTAMSESAQQDSASPANDYGMLFDSQSEPDAEPPGLQPTPATHTTAATLFEEDEWPSGPISRPAQANATEAPVEPTDASAVVQTNATSVSFDSPSAGSVRTAEILLGETDVDDAPAGPGIDFTEIDRLLATGTPSDEIDAHRLLSTMYWQQPEARGALRERIDELAQKIYFQGSRHYMDPHQVQPGDLLQTIARQYDVSWQYLSKLNRVDPKRVRAGQQLKVIKGPFSAIVDLSDFELTIHAHGYYVTRYAVGIGKDGSSPIGKFTVQEKLVDPTYYGPDGVIDHDDPANPLGERWIDIGNSYGIHGTIDPASIGKSESKGCIRLHNDDVEAVFDLLTVGSEVVIRP